MYNFLSALSIILGVIVSYAFIQAGDYLWILTGIAAGNLLYIAASDMIPELNTKRHHGHFKYTFFSTLLGLILIVGLLEFTHPEADENHSEPVFENQIAH